MNAYYDEKQKAIFAYGDEAKLWLETALISMYRRTGWKFPECIENWLYETIQEVGFKITSDPTETLWRFDNAYVNGSWGHIDNKGWSKNYAKRLYRKGELVFFDRKRGYYVEYL